MTIKIELLTIFLVVTTAGSAWARLGETENQLIERYGKEISNRPPNPAQEDGAALDCVIAFSKSGFLIQVMLFHGVSAKESISKDDPRSDLSDQEIKTLLDANAQGHTWIKNPSVAAPPPGCFAGLDEESWKRDDGASASYNMVHFDVKSKALIDAEAAAYKAAHTPPATSLQGF